MLWRRLIKQEVEQFDSEKQMIEMAVSGDQAAIEGGQPFWPSPFVNIYFRCMADTAFPGWVETKCGRSLHSL